VDIDTGKPFALGDFDIFAPPPQASSTGGQLVRGNQDNSAFTFAVTEQTATITLPIFDDPDRTENGAATDADGPLRNDDIGEEQTTFSIAANDAYTVSASAGSVTLTLKDTNEVVAPNAAPVADDDSYTTDFDTSLTVNAATGVLDGDTDADGDTLTATIEATPGNGDATVNDDGSFTYTPAAGFSGDDSFTYTVSDGNGGTDTATVSVTVNPEVVVPPTPATPQVSLSTSTNFGGSENALVEDEGTALTVQFDLDGPAPAGGLRLFIDSDVEQIVNRLDLPAFAGNPQAENINLGSVGTDFDNTGLVLTINEGATSASLTIPIFDNPEPDTFLPATFDGKVDAVFSLKTADQVSAEDAGDVQGLSDYTVNPAAASSTVTFVDTASQIAGGGGEGGEGGEGTGGGEGGEGGE
ncbi:MAG: Ig-like domain-containing protein, partial [Pseudomonadota bacterium]